MKYDPWLERIHAWKTVAKVTRYGAVRELGRSFPVVRLDVPGARRVLITAGFHGEEPAGPLTLARHFGAIARYAREKGVGLTVFPCINPSGFELGNRYNASGERPNNDFLRYRVGRAWKGELEKGEQHSKWRRYRYPPQETRLLHEAVAGLPTPLGALDIHQDNYAPWRGTYAYVFGDREHYRPVATEAGKHLPVARRRVVDPRLRTDSLGLIWFHDGSITDYFFRRGSRFTATLETTTHSPLESCHRVNLAWIRGFIDLASGGG